MVRRRLQHLNPFIDKNKILQYNQIMNYEYQFDSAQKIITDITTKNIEAAVLAATPGSGKTTISQIVIQKYIYKHPNAKILVLTHGQNLLKNQYIDSLNNPHFDIDFSFCDINNIPKNLPQVFIGLPQSIRKLPVENIDLLIVDECHEFYLKPMVQNIIKILKPKHQILLTGSPSEFIRLKSLGKKYEITFISGSELMDNDIFSSVEMDVIPIKGKRIQNSIEHIQKMFEHAKTRNKDLSKIMIAVNSIKQANEIANYLKFLGRNVALSTFKNDKESSKVKQFKEGMFDTLIVVQRGILGFSDNNITGLFDLRCSPDVDISNQLFSRVLRKHPDNIFKFYYRCGDKNTSDFNNQVIMLHKVKAMMRKDIFTTYNGLNIVVKMNGYFL
jgi:superfamily II DNA or RNA helicase